MNQKQTASPSLLSLEIALMQKKSSALRYVDLPIYFKIISPAGICNLLIGRQ
jgi:hypothetical protein